MDFFHFWDICLVSSPYDYLFIRKSSVHLMLMVHVMFREHSSNTSVCLGGGLSQNADTADALEVGGGLNQKADILIC